MARKQGRSQQNDTHRPRPSSDNTNHKPDKSAGEAHQVRVSTYKIAGNSVTHVESHTEAGQIPQERERWRSSGSVRCRHCGQLIVLIKGRCGWMAFNADPFCPHKCGDALDDAVYSFTPRHNRFH